MGPGRREKTGRLQTGPQSLEAGRNLELVQLPYFAHE